MNDSLRIEYRVAFLRADLDRLRAAARRHERSLQGEIRYAIRVYLASVERREQPQANGEAVRPGV